MFRSLLLGMSIWSRISCSTAILPLLDDTSDPFVPGRSILDADVVAIDTQSNLFSNAELTPSYDCFSDNIPLKANLRARNCNPYNLRTKPQTTPEGETQQSPTGHGGRDPQTPNEENPTPESNQGNQDETKPEEEPTDSITNVQTIDPWTECKKFLGGILKYAVCDSGNAVNAVSAPLPLVYLNAPFWTLSYCTLGRLVRRHTFQMIFPTLKMVQNISLSADG
ncbi:hypothetical protein MMC07_006779 [Pseudocyphellaria aurata]|nr:hypothetical protein [Pseudocyphellaria aurata]